MTFARSFTMIECVAVVAIVAIAVASLAAGLAPSAHAARLRDARGALLDLDARARLLARQGTPAVVKIEGSHGIVTLAADDNPILVRTLHASVSAHFLDPRSAERLAEVRIGANGCGADYLVALRMNGIAREMLISGLTGYVFERDQWSEW